MSYDVWYDVMQCDECDGMGCYEIDLIATNEIMEGSHEEAI